MLALGEYPDMGLADAREALSAARALVAKGVNPAHERKAAKFARITEGGNTFRAVALEWMEQLRAKGRTPYYMRQIESAFAADVFPAIGALPIRDVSAAHLLRIIKGVEKRGAEVTALNIRQWCSAVFRYAVATLRADSDPAAALKGAVHRPRTEHHAHLTPKELPAFLKALEAYRERGQPQTVIALRLLLLLFVRPGELRAAKWHEFDLDEAEWRIPGERMKMREPHLVPLPPQAVELLRELHTITGTSEWLFPNARDPRKPMTGTTTNRALEYMGYGGRVSSHGFRGTASTVLNEAGYREDVIERQLAHKPRNTVRASYNHAQYLPERRQMLQDWADMVSAWAAGAKVIPGKFGQSPDEPKDEAWTLYRARRGGTDATVYTIDELKEGKQS